MKYEWLFSDLFLGFVGGVITTCIVNFLILIIKLKLGL